MDRFRALALSGLLLAAWGCGREPSAGAAPASAAAPAAAATAAPPGLLVRYALLVGGRGAGAAPAAAAVLSRDELTKTLLDWDTDSDSTEVKRLFALHHLGEVARQAYELPPAGGHARGFYNYGGAVYELGLEARPRAGDTILFEAEIRRDGKVLSAPQVIARLGERAILSTENGGETPFLFFVVEATPAPAVAAAGAAAAADEVRPGPDGVYKVDGDRVRPPKAVHRVDPSYTDAARKAGTTGQVVLECIVDEEGKIADVKVVRGLPEGLDQAAIDAIRQWRFEPARLDGEPVKVRFTLTINFKLDDEEKPAAAARLLGRSGRGERAAALQPPRHGAAQLGEPLAGAGRDPEVAVARRRFRRRHQVALVEHPQHARRVDAEVAEHALRHPHLLLPLRVAAVDDVDHEVGRGDLFERALERGHQVVRQLADEAHGVGEDRHAAVAEHAAPQLRVEGREEPVLGRRRRPGSGR